MFGYVVVDEVGRDGFSFLFSDNPFFEPLDRLPAFELDEDFVGCHVFEEVEENAAVDSITSDVEGLVDLDEYCSHIYLMP